MVLGDRTDPYPVVRFHVELDGLIVAGFADVSGLELEVETEEYEEGGTNHYTHQLPTRVTYPTLTMSRGITDSEALWEWAAASIHGPAERRNGRVILLDSQGSEVRGWEFHEGYPVRWEGPEFSADQGDVAIETLEIAHHGLTAHDV